LVPLYVAGKIVAEETVDKSIVNGVPSTNRAGADIVGGAS
jgi:hypothetical protein